MLGRERRPRRSVAPLARVFDLSGACGDSSPYRRGAKTLRRAYPSVSGCARASSPERGAKVPPRFARMPGASPTAHNAAARFNHIKTTRRRNVHNTSWRRVFQVLLKLRSSFDFDKTIVTGLPWGQYFTLPERTASTTGFHSAGAVSQPAFIAALQDMEASISS